MPLGSLLVLSPFPAFAGTAADSLAAVPGVPEINLFWQTLQVIIALVLTIVLLVGTVWLFRKILKIRRFSGISGGAIHILEVHYMDPRKAIALVRVLDRVLIIGYSENSIAMLGELSPEEAGSLAQDQKPDSDIFSALLSRFSRGGSDTAGGGTGKERG